MSNEILRLFGCVRKSENKGERCQKKNCSSPWSHIRENLKLSSDRQVCFAISTQSQFASIVYSRAKTTNYEKLYVNSSVDFSVSRLEKDLVAGMNPSNKCQVSSFE